MSIFFLYNNYDNVCFYDIYGNIIIRVFLKRREFNEQFSTYGS